MIERELERMSRMHPETAEYGVARTYLEWLTSMPWGTFWDRAPPTVE